MSENKRIRKEIEKKSRRLLKPYTFASRKKSYVSHIAITVKRFEELCPAKHIGEKQNISLSSSKDKCSFALLN